MQFRNTCVFRGRDCMEIPGNEVHSFASCLNIIYQRLKKQHNTIPLFSTESQPEVFSPNPFFSPTRTL